MKTRRILTIAWENMKQRKLRTSLTTLGVVIGITAIIGIASLGEGFRIEIKDRMQTGFELNNLTIIPGSFFAGLSRERFKDENIGNISEIDGIKVATGVMQLGNVTLYHDNKKVQAFVATAVNFTEFTQVFPDRFVFENNTTPTEYANDTIVIGHKVDYPSENDTEPFAVANDTINVAFNFVGNKTFTVGGILQKKGTPGITNFDYWVFIPLQRAREIYNDNHSDLIFVKLYDPEQADRITKDIEALFPPYRVTILAPSTFIKQVDNILTIVQLFLMAIASISLLVAGIGIMNIMTVSVMERTREIGILKAVGAKNRTVLGMFLAEAILIGIVGGLIGIFTGYGLSYALAFVLSSYIQTQQQQGTSFQNPEAPQKLTITPVFSPEWTIIAVIFAVTICIIFGLYPARKAAKLDPVKALQYE
jgi:putative ABC transport system permease protein